MQILHVSAECFPAAKVGGLADVVGSLPKYLNKMGENCEVIIPKYGTEWIVKQKYEDVYKGKLQMGLEYQDFVIQKLNVDEQLGYTLFVVDIPGRTDRPGVYIDPYTGHAYWDEFKRFLSFQIAVLEWVKSIEEKPDVIHCHDHHTGLIPFMLQESNRFRELTEIPSVITVHNAEYQGIRPRDYFRFLPAFSIKNIGLLDWNGALNSLAAALKCAWKITTVSNSYLDELKQNSNGLEQLFRDESSKSKGILNGIDNDVWNPATDEMLEHNYSFRNRKAGKSRNKQVLCEMFNLNPEYPIIAFIGRLVREKGADLLPDLFRHFMQSENKINFVLLGTGEAILHQAFEKMQSEQLGYFDAKLKYNEKLAHQIYAGSDFIIMPSRVEPCGLNQMFAMRYGTIPIVRGVGGLKDTVIDFSEENGYGIVFNNFNLLEAKEAVSRALQLYQNKKEFSRMVSKVMKLDFSWTKSAEQYLELYKSLT